MQLFTQHKALGQIASIRNANLTEKLCNVYWGWGGSMHARIHAAGADGMIQHVESLVLRIQKDFACFCLGQLSLGDLSFSVVLCGMWKY